MARESRRGGRRLDVPQEQRRLFAMPTYDAESFGRLAEGFARFMGTARFIVYMSGVIVVWITWNMVAPHGLEFDPRSKNFTLLTLILSVQASYAAPLILLAQNRQADRDRVALEEDRARNERSIADTEYLTREVASLRVALGEVATRDFLRGELQRLLDELDGARRDDEDAAGPRSDNEPGRPSPPAASTKRAD